MTTPHAFIITRRFELDDDFDEPEDDDDDFDEDDEESEEENDDDEDVETWQVARAERSR